MTLILIGILCMEKEKEFAIYREKRKMTKIIASPTRYIQGKGELKRLASHASTLGKKLFVIVDANIKDIVKPDIESSLVNTDVTMMFEDFQGECSMNEINRIAKIVNENGTEVIVGVGGGKTDDTSKAVAFYSKTQSLLFQQ